MWWAATMSAPMSANESIASLLRCPRHVRFAPDSDRGAAMQQTTFCALPDSCTAVDDRRFLNGILWILQSDAPWRDLPKSFAPGLNRRTPHRRSLDSTFTNKSRATRRVRMRAIAASQIWGEADWRDTCCQIG